MMWTKEETAEHRKLWVEALRSGEYTQCRSVLSNGVGHCCLGVACEVANKNGLSLDIVRNAQDEFGEPLNHVSYNGFNQILPHSVKEWLGFGDELNFTEDDLIHMNDSDKANFNQIANVIEQNKPEDADDYWRDEDV